MAKELPYFRFTAQEWQNGDISLENYELKGLFIDICSYYWVQDCSITKAMLEKRFRYDTKLLNELLDLNIIKEEDDFILISFLNEQFDLLSEKRQRRQKAGRLGGKAKSSNAKAMLKQKPSYKDNDKEKDKYKDKYKSKKFTPPLLKDVQDYFKENGYTNAKRAFDYYEAANWHDAKGNKIKNWKQKMIGVWFKEENKINTGAVYTPPKRLINGY